MDNPEKKSVLEEKEKEEAILDFIKEGEKSSFLLDIEASLGSRSDPFMEEFSIIKRTKRE